jgi:cysteine desulfurase
MSTPFELYLDHNATSPLLDEVVAAMNEATQARLANPSSPHAAGELARRRLERARERVAALLHATSEEVVFTSGGSEANQLALFGLLSPRFAGRHVVVSAIEHASLLDAAALLEELGARVTRVAPGRDGRVSAASIVAARETATALVALMAANNETGVLQPVDELGAELARRSIPFHVDAVQAIARTTVDAATVAASTIAISAHKLGGPAGIGALFVRRGRRLAPFLRGGRTERGRRGGTPNLLGAIGFGVAAQVTLERSASSRLAAARARDEFERALLAELDVEIVGTTVPRLPNTSSVHFRGRDGAALVTAMSGRGLFAATGSACESGAPEPSHVLRAMGRPAAEARATVRFSFGADATVAEARRAAEVVVAAAGSSAAVHAEKRA